MTVVISRFSGDIMDRRDFIQGGIAALVLGTSAGASVPLAKSRTPQQPVIFFEGVSPLPGCPVCD
jgi:hypothetical protein